MRKFLILSVAALALTACKAETSKPSTEPASSAAAETDINARPSRYMV